MKPQALKKLVADLNQDISRGLNYVDITYGNKKFHFCMEPDAPLEYDCELDILTIKDDGTRFIDGASIIEISI